MFAQERMKAIDDLLGKRARWTLGELQSELGVSPATLRRDLALLETEGRLVRVRGAVVHPAFFRAEPTLAQKSRVAGAVKRAIAQKAAEFVSEGASVWIDAGTTPLALGRLLLSRPDVSIWTNSLPLAHLSVEGEAKAKVVCIGGEVRAVSGALVGALSLAWLEPVRVDVCFVGASGLDEDGASTTELSEAGLKSAILTRSSTKVLLCDARKWNNPATVRFARWSDFDCWVGDASDEMRRAVEKQGVRVEEVRI